METSEKIHFIGIGGIGMSGIARILSGSGHAVQGSDIRSTPLLEELSRQGIRVFIGHDAAHVKGATAVVYSSSIRKDHPELREAQRLGIRVLHRSEALAALCEGRYTIAVTGTHGKTTTTALIGMILKEAGRDPSIVVGGVVSAFGGNACLGSGREIVIEADESDGSFVRYAPALEVITNIEEEHMDHYGSIEAVEQAYLDFIHRMPARSRWIGCAEDTRVLRLAGQSHRQAVLYGLDPKTARFCAEDIRECEGGRRGVVFTVRKDGILLGEVRLKLIGKHNVLNALAAIAAADEMGISFEVSAAGLARYEGAGRRFDIKYENAGLMIVDDYAHHPTEIQKTLSAARGLGRTRVVVLFQPHRYSRTAALIEEFGKSFFDADKLLVTDIYAAGEEATDVDGQKVCDAIRKAGHADVEFVSRADAFVRAAALVREGDLFISMGAGDVYRVADELAERWASRRDAGATEDPFGGIRGKVSLREPLGKHTTLKIGGPADYWIEPADEADLAEVLAVCRKRSIRTYLFGAGSNLLAPDEGLRGACIHLGSAYFKQIHLEGHRVIVRAGVPNTLFIQFALEHGLGGCEFLSGIPGSVGGSIVMNAGSHGQSLDALLISVAVLDGSGKRRVLQRAEIPFGYRSSGLKNCVVLEGVFELPNTPREQSQRILDEYRDYRAKTQDLWHASAGCMFKNPVTGGCSSGRLIEESGLKGYRVGNAQVSEKHANFIINLGGATAQDVLELINRVRNEVRIKKGIELETEVRLPV